MRFLQITSHCKVLHINANVGGWEEDNKALFGWKERNWKEGS